MNIQKSKSLFAEAQMFIPGGVNSPVRAFKSVGGDPIFIKSAKGAYLYDEDGNKYIDLINSWGPMILGHAHAEVIEAVQTAAMDSFSFGAPTEAEVEMARLICSMIPSVEKVRMVNSGTEATMSAIRLARGFTSRNKFIKFEGCYHGHGDSFLIAAGSGALTFGIPNSPGVTEGTAKDTLTATYNNLESVEQLFRENPVSIAAIIIEPVAGNMGCIEPEPGFLEGLREICDREGALLIFDEVMTGFRISLGGAQEYYKVKPDLTTLGKIIGGGMPVGAYGGRKDVMDFVSPQGPVYQAGTLSGNPIAMKCGMTTLRILKETPGIYQRLNGISAEFEEAVSEDLNKRGIPFAFNRQGSMFTLFFNEGKVKTYADAVRSDTKLFGNYFKAMLAQGVYLPPSQFEAAFLCNALSTADVDHYIVSHKKAMDQILK